MSVPEDDYCDDDGDGDSDHDGDDGDDGDDQRRRIMMVMMVLIRRVIVMVTKIRWKCQKLLLHRHYNSDPG